MIRIPGFSGVILAGGASRRMGTNKALLRIGGEFLVETLYHRLAAMFDEVLLVTNDPESYRFLDCRMIPDIFAGMGPLAGIHAALSSSSAESVFVCGCDMPDLDPRLISALCALSGGEDTVPETPEGPEPLHAVYSRSSLALMERMLGAGERSVLTFIARSGAKIMTVGEVSLIDPAFSSFRNLNTPEDYLQFDVASSGTIQL